MEYQNPPCPKCGGKTSKSGHALRKGGKVQSYKCNNCGYVFVKSQVKAKAAPVISKPKKLAEKGHSLI